MAAVHPSGATGACKHAGRAGEPDGPFLTPPLATATDGEPDTPERETVCRRNRNLARERVFELAIGTVFIISQRIMSMGPMPSTFSPSREIGFALNDVARLLRTYADQRARDLNTTRAQWAVLVKLQRCEGVKQAELADSLDLAPITLGRLIDKLTAAGLVERRDDAHDRRAHRLFLTDKAVPALNQLGALGEDLMGRALAGLAPEALETLRQSLERIRSNLKTELSPKPQLQAGE